MVFKKHRFLCWAMVAWISTGCGKPALPCGEVPPRTSNSTLDSTVLATLLADFQQAIGSPAVQMAVRKKDGSAWSGAIGCANVSEKRPLQLTEQLPIGSVTKTLTAAALLKLQEEGKLKLDDAVSKYLPNVPRASEYTVRQLLNHTAAVPDYLQTEAFQKAFRNEPEKVWSDEALLELVTAAPFTEAPGKQFSYSNGGYILAGEVIRVASGGPRDNTVDGLLQPLGISIPVWTAALHTVDSYASDCQGPSCPLVLNAPLPYRQGSAGGAAGDRMGTATALTDWANALYGGRVLSKESLSEMRQSIPVTGDWPKQVSKYGLGDMTFVSAAGQSLLGHSGLIANFSTLMLYDPESGASLAVIVNAEAPGFYESGLGDFAVKALEVLR